MTEYGLNLSAWGKGLDLYAAIPQLAEAGFRRCELMEEGVDLSTGTAVERLRRLLDSHGVRPFAMHAPYKQDLASLNETVRRLAVHTTIRSFAGFADVGGHTVVVHPNADEGPHSVRHYPLYEAALLKSLDDIHAVVERLGLTIAVENMLHRGTARPFWRADELLEAVSRFPERIGICIDTGHARASGLDPAAQIRVAGPRLRALHLHDNDGLNDLHLVPGLGVIDWPGVHAAIAEAGFAGSSTIEVQAHEDPPGAIARQAGVVAAMWNEGRYETFASGIYDPAAPALV